jgi:predicted GH43/DUF377 family glycosyl hydrolase
MWWMYYFGGSLDDPLVLPSTAKSLPAMRLRIGLCKSRDGLHGFDAARHDKPILHPGHAPDDWDRTMVAWARVLPPSSSLSLSRWLMTYASMDTSGSFAIGSAVSDDGVEWTKLGKILEPGPPGSWDDAGVSRRHVVLVDRRYLMFYEGVNTRGVHAIGLATSNDGFTWLKDSHADNPQPGGPIFAPDPHHPDAWDAGGVSCPHVVVAHDSLRLYYVGFDLTKKFSAFGLAIADKRAIRRFRRV